MAKSPYDNFVDLRIKGMDAQMARQQAYGATPVAPITQDSVAPQTVAPPPVPTPPPVMPPTPVAPTLQGVDGSTFQQANNPDGTPIAQPGTVSASVPTPPPVETKIESIKVPSTTPDNSAKPLIDYNSSMGRESEISNHLNTFYSQGMTDPNTIRSSSGYDQADAGKKAIIDGFINAKTPTVSGYLGSLINKIDIPVAQQNTPEYRLANQRYQKANTYVNLTAGQVLQSVKNGDLIEGSQAWEDLKGINPSLVESVSQLKKVNGVNGTSDKTKVEYGATQDLLQAFPELFKTQSLDQIKQSIQTDDYLQAQTTANGYRDEIARLEMVKSGIAKDIGKELTGTGVNDSYKQASADARTRDIDNQISLANAKYTTAFNTQNQILTNNLTAYQKQQDQIVAKRSLVMNEYQKNLALQTSQAQFDQQLAQKSQLAKDPQTAIQTVMDEYKKLGIPFTSTIQSRLAEFKASGLSLPDFLTSMSKNIQSSPGYKAYLVKTADKAPFQAMSLGDGKALLYNQTTGRYETIGGSGTGSPSNPSPSSGRIVPVSAGGKTVYLDENASSGFQSAIKSAETAGAPIFFSKGARDQAQTIQEMASDPNRGGKFGISFNASNPNETASQLCAKGFQIADVGKSNHETGMAIDVYSDSSMKSGPTPAQEQILNANGWYSGNIPGDAGHFEYKGGQGTMNITNLPQYINYYENNSKLPTGMKDNTPEAEKFKEDAYTAYTAYKKEQLQNSGISVGNIDNYINVDPKIRDKLDNSIDQMSTIIRNIKSMKDLVNTNGTELTTWTDGGKQMDSLFSDTATKMKEIYNLGVLNGPDLGIISSSLASPVGTSAFFTTNANAKKYLENVETRLLSDINTKAKRYGISFGEKTSGQGNTGIGQTVEYRSPSGKTYGI